MSAPVNLKTCFGRSLALSCSETHSTTRSGLVMETCLLSSHCRSWGLAGEIDSLYSAGQCKGPLGWCDGICDYAQKRSQHPRPPSAIIGCVALLWTRPSLLPISGYIAPSNSKAHWLRVCLSPPLLIVLGLVCTRFPAPRMSRIWFSKSGANYESESARGDDRPLRRSWSIFGRFPEPRSPPNSPLL